MCFYTANSILVRGAVMDGAGEGTKGIVFPTHYLRFFYKVSVAFSRPPSGAMNVVMAGGESDSGSCDAGSCLWLV